MKAVQPGRLELRLSGSYVDMTTGHVAECPDLGPECATSTPPTPYNHHIDQVMGDLNLDASIGVMAWLAIEARLILRFADIDPSYSELDGTPKRVPNDIHHHDVTYVGPGDPWLVARLGARVGDVLFSSRLGVTIPIGRTEPDPYALGARGKWHEHLQFGTGTFLPIVGGGVTWTDLPVEPSLALLGLFSLYDNGEGYRAPSRLYASLRATVPLLEGDLRPFATVDLAHEGEEIWHGNVGDEGSNVRTDLLVGGGVAWRFARDWETEVGLRFRAARLTDARSFDYPFLAQLSLARSFDLAGDERPPAPHERAGSLAERR